MAADNVNSLLLWCGGICVGQKVAPQVTCASRHGLSWCNASGCPGAPIGRKWEAFNELLAAARFALSVIDTPDAPDSGASPILVLVRQQLRAAITRAEGT